MKKAILFGFGVPALLAVIAVIAFTRHDLAQAGDAHAAKTGERKPSEAAVTRARKQLKMLDTIYKQTVVLITDKYVHDEDDFPAGSAAIALFKAVTDAGFHRVRLIDATGDPYDSENVAKDEFERDGIEKLKAGSGVVEEVRIIDGKPQLRALTAVPVVMKKCIMCHEHYADAKPGEPVGAISYTIPIE